MIRIELETAALVLVHALGLGHHQPLSLVHLMEVVFLQHW